MLTAGEGLVLAAYYLALAGLAFYGSHRLRLIARHYRVPDRDPDPPAAGIPPATPVLVQLPVFNERLVVERLLQSCAALGWSGPLRVQLVDDSDDETTAVAEGVAGRLRGPGREVTVVRRAGRDGYKAGALAHGLAVDAGHPDGPAPLVAIFDADFVPGPDFLQRTLPFFAEPSTALVQVRWEHLNREDSLLTRLQSIFLDGHFVLESAVRFRCGHFFNFNGTAGVWRRSAIEDAGGWSGETLTEDLDLSYRALLRGWRFVFLNDVTAPAEVPATMRDFKSQQGRWTKGAIEVARRLLGDVLAAPLPLATKLEAFLHLTNNLSYPLVVLLALLVVPSIEIRARLGWLRLLWIDLPLFLLSSVSVGAFYIVSQRALGRAWRKTIRLVPMMMSLGIGMAVGNAIGVIEALAGRATPFLRTPKRGRATRGFYRSPVRPALAAEAALALYFAGSLAWAVSLGLWAALPFLMVFFSGFFYGTLLSLLPGRPAPARRSV